MEWRNNTEGCEFKYLEQGPVFTDEPLGIVQSSLHGGFDQRGQRLGERREVLLLVFSLSPDLQHAGFVEERPRRDHRLAVALFLLPAHGC